MIPPRRSDLLAGLCVEKIALLPMRSRTKFPKVAFLRSAGRLRAAVREHEEGNERILALLPEPVGARMRPEAASQAAVGDRPRPRWGQTPSALGTDPVCGG